MVLQYKKILLTLTNLFFSTVDETESYGNSSAASQANIVDQPVYKLPTSESDMEPGMTFYGKNFTNLYSKYINLILIF